MSLLNNVDFPTLGRPTTATTGRAIGITTYLFYFGYQNSASSRSAPSTGSISTRIDRAWRHLVGGGVVQEAVALPPEHVPGKEKNVRLRPRSSSLNPGRSADGPR